MVGEALLVWGEMTKWGEGEYSDVYLGDTFLWLLKETLFVNFINFWIRKDMMRIKLNYYVLCWRAVQQELGNKCTSNNCCNTLILKNIFSYKEKYYTPIHIYSCAVKNVKTYPV